MAKGLHEVWEARKRIFDGIKNSIFKKDDVEKIALARLAICDTCKDIDKKGDKCILPGSQPCCGLCGCKLAWKARCLAEGCDEGKWEAILSEEEEADVNHKLGIDPFEHV